MKDSQVAVHRSNNFDFLRLAFAVFVIISHAYPLSGLPDSDWLNSKTGISFSYLGLGGFFSISGFLVTQSAQRSPSFGNFIQKRSLRIFPGLLVNLVLIAFVLGPVVSGIAGYFSKGDVYSYVPKNLSLFRLQYCIDGVFSRNPFGCAINGSLWTLCYEFFFYLLFVVLFLIKPLNRYLKFLLPILMILLLILRWKKPEWDLWVPYTGMQMNQMVHFGIWFVSGMLLAVYAKSWTPYKLWLSVAAALAMTFALCFEWSKFLLYAIWPVFVLSFGLCSAPVISRLGRVGDSSYGVYIYGFVVQQTLIYYLHPELSFSAFMLLSIGCSVLIGLLSWHLVEKQALKWKPGAKRAA